MEEKMLFLENWLNERGDIDIFSFEKNVNGLKDILMNLEKYTIMDEKQMIDKLHTEEQIYKYFEENYHKNLETIENLESELEKLNEQAKEQKEFFVEIDFDDFNQKIALEEKKRDEMKQMLFDMEKENFIHADEYMELKEKKKDLERKIHVSKKKENEKLDYFKILENKEQELNEKIEIIEETKAKFLKNLNDNRMKNAALKNEEIFLQRELARWNEENNFLEEQVFPFVFLIFY